MICGGSALNLSGLISRTTEDVDVLGLKSGALEVEPLPAWLLQCAAEVAHESGIEEEWFNDAAYVLKGFGFPHGMLNRVILESFGESLEVAIVSRLDLVAMKCLAALDPKFGRRHLEDLVDLAPNAQELAFAREWLFARPTSLEFRDAFLKLCLVLGMPADALESGTQ
jgi:hypothetical protein